VEVDLDTRPVAEVDLDPRPGVGADLDPRPGAVVRHGDSRVRARGGQPFGLERGQEAVLGAAARAGAAVGVRVERRFEQWSRRRPVARVSAACVAASSNRFR
jgi:hypothetical protein